MGNSSTKESRSPSSRSRPEGLRQVSTGDGNNGPQSPQSPADRLVNNIYASRGGRGSRPDLSFLQLALAERDAAAAEPRRETKQERDARKLEKERVAREKERERSIREEGVDGGYLVTLGTYTGPEDFNKAVVRQLMIERRLAPFWTGLNDHRDSWVEHQLVAAVRGIPIPAADEIPLGMERSTSQMSSDRRPTDANVNNLTIPISSRSQSYASDTSANLSASHPAFSNSGPTSPSSPTSGSMPLFRGRAKTLASLTTSSRGNSSSQLTPQEVQLPKDPNINGQAIEAYLYKDASECPICFLYYPPYLNKTRCCDQPICSECFVQIKRPDPHPPEHHDDPSNPTPAPKPEEEEGLLVSEPSACPFCVTPEFGVTYEAPPFRRGLAYAGHPSSHPLAAATSAMSSSSSLGSMPGPRRRTTSLSASASSVITTDRVRPDWAKKLSDARAHALRRSAAATALHNAAFVLGNPQSADARGILGRRRRNLFDSPGASGSGTPRVPEGLALGNLGALLANAERRGEQGDSSDLYPGRTSSRRNRVDDLEELMMMEAIRLSLAAEEDRKRKEEKDAAKDAKKRAKEAAKEAKKEAKAAKKAGTLYTASTNESTSTWASSSMVRSTSNLGLQPVSSQPSIGKGKAPANATVGFNPLEEPTSTLNMGSGDSANGKMPVDAQKHLEDSRANLNQPSQPIAFSSPTSDTFPRSHLRHISNASSAASSFMDSGPASLRNESGFGVSPNESGLDVSNSEFPSAAPTNPGTGPESMFNFRSLAAMIGEEEKKGHEAEHAEHLETAAGADRDPPPASQLSVKEAGVSRARGNTGESSSSGPPPVYVEHTDGSVTDTNGVMDGEHDEAADSISPVKVQPLPHDAGDRKEHVQVLDNPQERGITQ